MKIGLIRHAMDDPQGGARQVALLARDLCQLGEDVTVYCYRYDRDRCFPDILASVPVRAVQQVTAQDRLGSERGWRRTWAQLRRYYVEAPAIASLIERNTDILNPHEWLAHRAAALFGTKSDVPIIWSYNDPSGWHVSHVGKFEFLPEHVFGWFDSRLVNRFAALTVLDRRMQAIAAASFTTPAYIVRSGVDAGLFAKGVSFSGRRASSLRGVHLLSVGILFPHRRFEDAIRAVHLARGSKVDCSYEIIGSDRFCPAYGASLRALVRDLDLAGAVNLRFESVSEEDLGQAYMNADGLVFPNQGQTWGLAVLEAMARGLPVIVSRGAGVHEVLVDGENALLVDPGRPDRIAAAIGRFAREPDLRSKLGAAGRQLVHERYTSRHYSEQMLRLFRTYADAT